MGKIKTNDIIVVEGKYDRIKLSTVVDGPILETDGFAIFSTDELKNTLRSLAKDRYIIIMTDSDAAGFRIRNYISSFLPQDRVKHALIPDVYGKERRKTALSKEGKLGVEGIEQEALYRALMNAGITYSERLQNSNPVTVADLFELGFTGKRDSVKNRQRLLCALELPKRTSITLMLSLVNSVMTKEAFLENAYRIIKKEV